MTKSPERDGWVLVPREPTVSMCDAATRATSGFLNIKARGVELRRIKHAIRWRAMVAVAEKTAREGSNEHAEDDAGSEDAANRP